ncbi:unnamed protein product [Cunninghamella blakesleeana]
MFWKKKDKKESSDTSSVSSNPFESSSSMTSGSSVDNKYNDSYSNSQAAPPSGGRYGNYQQNRDDLLGSRPPTSRQYDSQGNEMFMVIEIEVGMVKMMKMKK